VGNQKGGKTEEPVKGSRGAKKEVLPWSSLAVVSLALFFSTAAPSERKLFK